MYEECDQGEYFEEEYSDGQSTDTEDNDLNDDEQNDKSASSKFQTVNQSSDHPQKRKMGMTEQMYLDKLQNLRRQMTILLNRTHPDFTSRTKKVDSAYKERLRKNEIVCQLELDFAQSEFEREKETAEREFEDQKSFLKEQLITELNEKAKVIESERSNGMELKDYVESLDAIKQPISTRKLRRRAANDSNHQNNSSNGLNGIVGNNGGGNGSFSGFPGGSNEKRGRKSMQLSSISYLLRDSEMHDDLKIINKSKAFTPSHHSATSSKVSSRSGSVVYSSSNPTVIGSTIHGSSSNNTSSVSSTSKEANNSASHDTPMQQNRTENVNDQLVSTTPSGNAVTFNSSSALAKIIDGKLFYEKRWYRRGQAIIVECSSNKSSNSVSHSSSPVEKFPAMISAIGSDVIWVRKTESTSGPPSNTSNNNIRLKIEVGQLNKGKFVLRRRGASSTHINDNF